MSNSYFEKFKSELIYKHRDLLKISLSEWAEQNTYLGSRKFRIGEDYAFQKQILDDMHPHLVGIKLSQVGFTEIQLRKAIAFLCKYDGTTLIYTLPDLNMQSQVSSTRLKPMVQASPALEKNIGDTRTGKIFQFGNSFLHCLHAVESSATSIPADFIMNDELDLSDQEIITLFNSRLQNSDYKIKQRFSTPTFLNYGVDLDYKLSDQHEYLVKCGSCNHWQAPDYTWDFVNIPGRTKDMENIITDVNDTNINELRLDEATVVCEKCGAVLDLRGQREWVAKYPEKKLIRGYRVRPFTTPRLSIAYLATTLNEYRRKQNLRRGVNTVLGRAYEDGSARIAIDKIQNALKGEAVPEIGKLVPVFVGADLGMMCNISLATINSLGHPEVFKMFTVPETRFKETMAGLTELYNICGGCMDRYPYTPMVNDVRDKSDGIYIPVAYSGEKVFAETKDESGELDYYNVNRTFFADLVSNRIKNNQLQIRGYGGQGEVVKNHLRDMYREVDPETQKAKWVKLTGQDHYFHSLIYLSAAVYINETGYRDDETPNIGIGAINVNRPVNYPKPKSLL